MASKRAVRRRACEGKLKYDSKQAAAGSSWRISKGRGEPMMQPYRCQFCRAWHLGHSGHKMPVAG